MIQRFAESRRRLAADPHRPLYHFVSPESTLNDPNGNCRWQNRWHLFYQGYPPEEILKKADELNCDVIVMGTHGKGIIRHSFFHTC